MLPADLLARPAKLGARLVLIALIDALGASARALAAEGDEDSAIEVHAALRRLRNGLRVYRHLAPRRRVRAALRTLRRLARATGDAAKAASAVQLLRSVDAAPGPAAQRLADRLGERAHRKRRRARRALARALPRLLRRLRRSLARCELRVEAEPGPAFDTEARAAIERVAERLSCAVLDARDPTDKRAVRKVRRRVDELRDLLEPLALSCAALEGPLATLGHVRARLSAEQEARRFVRRIGKELPRVRPSRRAELVAIGEAARSHQALGLDQWLDALEPVRMLGGL